MTLFFSSSKSMLPTVNFVFSSSIVLLPNSTGVVHQTLLSVMDTIHNLSLCTATTELRNKKTVLCLQCARSQQAHFSGGRMNFRFLD
jgi:hypothetical protein